MTTLGQPERATIMDLRQARNFPFSIDVYCISDSFVHMILHGLKSYAMLFSVKRTYFPEKIVL